MINTSRDWRVALGCIQVPGRNHLVPINDIKIEYDQIDRTAMDNATISVNEYSSWSDHDEVLELLLDYSNEKPVATLEANEWILDGNTVLIGSSSHAGWVGSSFSKDDGTFDTNPKLTLTWSAKQTIDIPCISIQWSTMLDEWASQFSITAKYNGSSIYHQEFSNGKVQDLFGNGFVDYDEIEIEIKKWCLPHRHVRLEKLILGYTVEIDKSKVMSAEHYMSSDLQTFTLPNDYFTFEMENVGGEWNPDNPTGRYSFILKRQKVVVKYAFKINNSYEWHTFGTYYMTEWDTPQNGITVSFTARSLIDFMGGTFNPSSISGYTYGDSITLKQLAIAAFQQAGLPLNDDDTVKYQISDALSQYSVVIPYTTKQVEGETVNTWDFKYTCAEVVQLCANASGTLIRPNANGDIVVQTPVDVAGDYYIDGFVAFSNGEYSISKPLKTVNINDGIYIHTPSGSVSSGEEQCVDNQLIQTQAQMVKVSDWISDLLLKRKYITGEFRADPRLQPLDTITIDNKYARNFVYIDSVKFNYNGAFVGTYGGKVMYSFPLLDNDYEWYAGDRLSAEYGGY